MKITVITIAIFALLGFALVSQSSNESAETEQATSVQSAQTAMPSSFSEVEAAVADGARFIDVRTAEEFYDSHYVGAELLPLQDIETGTLPDASTDTDLYIYCRSGNRSAQAAQILERAGYTVFDLGGLQDVAALGGTITTDTCPLGDKVACLN